MGRSNFRTDLLRICVVWYAERNRQPCITSWIISDINLLNCNFGQVLKLSSRQCPPLVYHYTLHNTLASTLCQCRDNFHVILDRMQVGVGWKPQVNSRFRTNWQWASYSVSTVKKNEVTFLSTYITWPYRILLQFTVHNLFIPSILVTDRYRKTSWRWMSYACFV